MTFKRTQSALFVIAALGLAACGDKQEASSQSEPQALTKKDAQQFVEKAQQDLAEMLVPAAQAEWAYQTYINQDTAALSAYFNEKVTSKATSYAKEAAKFNSVEVDADTRRKLNLMSNILVMPAPGDPEKSARLAQIGSELGGMYGAGKYCRTEDECFSLPEMSNIMATERDPKLLLEMWEGWRQVSPPMKALYAEQTELANLGAQELGKKDLSEQWRGSYDMEADAFGQELDRLWGQVKPFYEALHCHVRAELGEKYGEDIVPQNEPIPAHLLGNMWGQSWGNVYDIVKPEQKMDVIDITKALEEHNYDEIKMVKQAESFFSSLGFDPLPETFWERSMFKQPTERDAVCHASAWNLDNVEDLRIKMCIQKNGEDFSTIHHELGHNYYQRAYNKQPTLYQGAANDGFHEAIGDTVALSITPKYLKEIGLVDTIPDASNDIGMLLKLALDKIAFVPFGLMVDQWRWKVFSGEVTPEQYNTAWWELREKYQGLKAPVDRPADAFDPGAKYHVPANTPYTRYFLAHILQFQFHRSLCEIAGDKGPIHRCSIYGSKEAGAALNNMLEMGQSKPWQEALETLTGKPEMDATAILDYFEPLKAWLDEQNQGRQCGW
ncbi:M2 family metallopeptidase [Aliiglaciecola sp. 2_MG-2023]|uniref:M2 family metallopeptidase n=1 Tax=unclassified Aliiglaciecola TaxID=2593648 RepID=UPI0026E2B57C|nr:MULTISPECIES: M2 family metallopeptidase [unclassified Aliiglaciecola]MDO6712237.1 M2 family metallopeptidase [Aliiglaciecola sp. 2_MG-2023]MDO6753525.1 M2 family metallopeptidase [Aliiglaciecola sp. 1_MG-2023]